MVEGARLESVYRGDSIVGSNPTVSAKYIHLIIEKYKYYLCADPLDTLWIHFLLSWGPIALFWLMAPTVPP